MIKKSFFLSLLFCVLSHAAYGMFEVGDICYVTSGYLQGKTVEIVKQYELKKSLKKKLLGVKKEWRTDCFYDYLSIGLRSLDDAPDRDNFQTLYAVHRGFGGRLFQGVTSVLGEKFYLGKISNEEVYLHPSWLEKIN